MKTHKGYDKKIGKVTLVAIFTLHHFSIGIYWAAPIVPIPYGPMIRRISISLHLPFFLVGVSWNIDVKKEIKKIVDKCPYCNSLPVANPQSKCWRYDCNCYHKYVDDLHEGKEPLLPRRPEIQEHKETCTQRNCKGC